MDKNSASVDDPATVGWKFNLYAMVLPARQITVLPKEQHVLMHVAQSELAKVWATVALCWGQLSSRRSYQLLLIVGVGPLSNLGQVAVCQKWIPSSFVLYKYFRACLKPW